MGDQDLQEADRGGRGDRRPQPGQVQEGPAGALRDRGALQARRGSDPPLNQNYLRHIAQEPRSPTLYRFFQKRPPWCAPKTKCLYDLYIHTSPSMTPPCIKNPKKKIENMAKKTLLSPLITDTRLPCLYHCRLIYEQATTYRNNNRIYIYV